MARKPVVDSTLGTIYDRASNTEWRKHLFDEEDEAEYFVSYRQGLLGVNATEKEHELCRKVLKDLEAVASRRYRIDCLLVPMETFMAASPGWQSRPTDISGKAFERFLSDKRCRLLSATASSGHAVSAQSKVLHAFLSDYDVDKSGAVPVSEPVVETTAAGDRVLVRPHFVPDNDSIILDVALGRFGTRAATERIGSGKTDLHLPETTERICSTTMAIEPGAVRVLASLAGDDAFAALIRVVPISRVPSPVKEGSVGRYRGGPVVRSYEVGPLLRTNRKRRWWAEGSSWRGGEFSASILDGDALMEQLQELTGGEDVWDGERTYMEMHPHLGVLFVRADVPLQERVAAVLSSEAVRRTEAAHISLEVLEVPRAVLVHVLGATVDGSVLNPNWRDVMEEVHNADRLRYFVSGVTGEVHALRNALILSSVVGVKYVGGCTSAGLVQVPDPVVAEFGEGREFRLQADLFSAGKIARLRLEGVETRIVSRESVAVKLGQAAGVKSATSKLELGLPRQGVTYWNVEQDLPVGRDVILHVEAAGETARVLVGKVTQRVGEDGDGNCD